MNSTPSLSEFNPKAVPYQHKVLLDIRSNFDYDLGTHEIMLSGSVGCLRKDALVETIFGKVPICDIKSGDYLLSYSHRKGQFVYQSCSGAYPKGKDYLYQVTTKRGKFVASGNHHISTFLHGYLPVSSLYAGCELSALPFSLEKKDPSVCQLSLISNVLRCWNKVLSLINHCESHIRQGDQQLLPLLNTVLDAFPLQADVQEYDQFSYYHKPLRLDDFLEMEQELGHTFESFAHPSMMNFLNLLENKLLDGVNLETFSKPCKYKIEDILQSPLFHLHNVHPKVVLFFLYRTCISLQKLLTCCVDKSIYITNDTVISIERLTKKEWYWDIKVPNSNNYIVNGTIHHNSAKSILLAHVAITHCLQNQNARFLLGRKAMPDLKDTILSKVLEHMTGDLEEGEDFIFNATRSSIYFTATKSEIICRSWSDKRYKKLRSLELSGAGIEELTENDPREFKGFYKELRARVGRLPHVKENIIICATNPDAPSHPAYDYFINTDNKLRHVYYSVTTDNPFLPKTYINQLLETFTKMEARRMIYGEWLELKQEVIYYEFSDDNIINSYNIDPRYPICLCYDFNIGDGKPMSACLFQKVKGCFYFFDECVIHTARTYDTLDDMKMRGIFDYPCKYIVHGDASGKNRDTRSIKTDYSIIEEFLANNDNNYEIDVPLANPPVRKRHNLMNGLMKNAMGQNRIFIAKDKCPTLIKGFKLTKLKEGGKYIEDDRDEWQHITTAAGYGCIRQLDNNNSQNRLSIGSM